MVKQVMPQRVESLVRADSEVPSLAGSEHNEQVALVAGSKADEGRTAGRAAMWQLLEFYRRMWLVIGITVVMAFGYYSFWAYIVPNSLCLEDIKNARGTRKTFLDCIYVNSGEYSGEHKARNIGFLLFWAIQHTWGCAFAILISFGLFEHRSFRWYDYVWSFGACITIFVFAVAGALKHGWNANTTFAGIVVPVPLSNISILVMGGVAARFSKNDVNRPRWYFAFLLSGFITLFYTFAMPRLVTSHATQQQKLFVRLILHPLIWGTIIALYRHIGRHLGKIPSLTQLVLFTYPFLYKTIYGRFLLLQLSSGSTTIALNALTCVIDVIGRLASRNADMMLLRLIYGRRPAQAILATEEVAEWRTAEVVARSLSEYVSIVAAASLFTFGHITGTPGVNPSAAQQWWVAVAQAVTFLVTDVAGIAIEMKWHKVDFLKFMPKRPFRILFFLGWLQLLGNIRLATELLLLFCPRYYPDQDVVLMEVCNKNSVFDHLRAWKVSDGIA